MDDQQRFCLERLSNTLFEAGKKVARTFLLSIGLIASTALLVFTEPTDKLFTVPIFQVELPRRYATEIFLILACASLYRYACLVIAERLLYKKFMGLLKSVSNLTGAEEWYMRYPSFAHFHGVMAPEIPGIIGRWTNFFKHLSMPFAFLLPIILGVFIGVENCWSWDFLITTLAGLFFLIPAFVFLSQLNSLDDKVVIEKLDTLPANGSQDQGNRKTQGH